MTSPASWSSSPRIPPAPRRITPRRPDLYRSRGPAAAAVLAAFGRSPLPWQRTALDLLGEVDDRGRYVHSTAVVLVPRRAGKTVVIGGAMHHRALTIPAARVFYTAQTGSDASTWFREEHKPMLDAATLFRGQWRSRMTNGSEQITWKANQSTVRVFAPTSEALHGRDSHLVVLDEAWAHDAARGADLLQAIGPTQAIPQRSTGAQIVIISAAGDASSTFLIEQLETARAALEAGDPSVVLIEYGVPDDEDATDPDVAARYHPAVGYTIDASYLHTERARLGADGFARAYGCRQIVTGTASSRLDLAQWMTLADPAPMPDRLPIAVGFDVSPDRDAAIVAAAQLPDGRIMVDLVNAGAGSQWVADDVAGLNRLRPRPTFGVDDIALGRDIADRLTRSGIAVTRLSARDFASACSTFATRVADGTIVHRGQPALDDAVAASATRTLGDAWAWSRRRSADTIAPLVAATVAVWTLEHGAPAPLLV